MDNQGNHQAAKSFAGGFAESLAEQLTGTSGSQWQVKVLDTQDLSAQQGQAIRFRLTMDGGMRGELYVELYELRAIQFLSKTGDPSAEAFTGHFEAAFGKLISAAMAAFSASLLAEYGEVIFKIDRAADLPSGGMFAISLAASGQDQSAIPVTLYFHPRLLAALSQRVIENPSEAEKSAAEPVNLKLVMDVELNVSLRFGQRQLPLREVLELASGSVVELDRQVDDPVELLLDGKVIARGEAVIVDGNYGLRVTEITEPIAARCFR